MLPNKSIAPSMSIRPARQDSNFGGRSRWSVVILIAVMAFPAAATFAAPAESSRETVVKIVAQIQKADYAGDRPALQNLYGELKAFATDEKIGSRVNYWRGFALWRRAINGFNDSADPKDIEKDLTAAIVEFKAASTKDPSFIDAKVGTISCLGNLAYLARGNATTVQDLIAQSSVLVKEAKAAAPENARLLWVLGPIYWNIPAERGGGQDKAIEGYQKGLEAIRQQKSTNSDPLEPSWGEPELLMSLAWSNLNRSKPDLNAAEQQARAALALVPYWHYTRDILLPQIQAAKTKLT